MEEINTSLFSDESTFDQEMTQFKKSLLKTRYEKFEDYIWYGAHHKFMDLVYNRGNVVRAIRIIMFVLLIGMWAVLYDNNVIIKNKSPVYFLTLAKFFT